MPKKTLTKKPETKREGNRIINKGIKPGSMSLADMKKKGAPNLEPEFAFNPRARK
jgi:hypothetical protein